MRDCLYHALFALAVPATAVYGVRHAVQRGLNDEGKKEEEKKKKEKRETWHRNILPSLAFYATLFLMDSTLKSKKVCPASAFLFISLDMSFYFILFKLINLLRISRSASLISVRSASLIFPLFLYLHLQAPQCPSTTKALLFYCPCSVSEISVDHHARQLLPLLFCFLVFLFSFLSIPLSCLCECFNLSRQLLHRHCLAGVCQDDSSLVSLFSFPLSFVN